MTAAGGVDAAREGAGAFDPRLTETQERFLRDAALRLPLDRVAELHVFPPMRQGGVETGIAVVAAHRAPAPTGGPAVELANDAAVAGPEMVDGALATDTPLAAGGTHDADGADEAPERAGGPPQVEDAQTADAARHQFDAERGVSAQPGRDSGAPAAAADDERLTVFSARYRHTLKGPDRGRWEVEVVEEADAPLASVDLVVRGVQRRAGEGAEPERLSAAQLRALLPERPAG